jgi:hypothetical protein
MSDLKNKQVFVFNVFSIFVTAISNQYQINAKRAFTLSV